MNFKQFLKQERLTPVSTSGQEVEEKDNRPNTQEMKVEEIMVKKRKNHQKSFFDLCEKNVKEKEVQNLFNPNEFIFKRGDFIKIIKIPRKDGEFHIRRCDIYKGYYGEIKEVKRSTNTAVVRMEATNNYHSVELPIDCLIRRDH